MNPASTIRQRQIPWARRTLGVFVLVWANLVLAPCVMAVEAAGDSDCIQFSPGIPGEAQSSVAGVAQDNVLQVIRCEAEASQCSDSDEYSYDSRTVQAKHSPDGAAVASHSPVAAMPVFDPDPVDRLDEFAKRADTPIPLNILYCVYLN